jgi:DHA2 family multidrug resistance protein-like MFS transporter
LAALALTTGSLADRLGHRRLFAVELATLSVASLLSALAPDPTLLSLARAFQGLGEAVTSPRLLEGVTGRVPRHA